MNDEIVREIVDVYLVKCEKGTLALCSEQESKNYIKLGKEKNLNVTTKKITTNLNRANEIGNNLFKINYPCKTREELIGFRNKLVLEWIRRCESIKNCNKKIVWRKVAEKHNISVETPEEFAQSISDKLEYIY
jgi:hypothetical protein